jgi:hypothetical protein
MGIVRPLVRLILLVWATGPINCAVFSAPGQTGCGGHAMNVERQATAHVLAESVQHCADQLFLRAGGAPPTSSVEAHAQLQLFCLYRLLPPVEYRPVQGLDDLGVGEDRRFVEGLLQVEYLPPDRGDYFAWHSPQEDLPDIVKGSYVAGALHLTVVHTKDALMLLVSAADVPVLQVPVAERRALVEETVRRLLRSDLHERLFRGQFRDRYCQIPDIIDEGMSVGTWPQSAGLTGWADGLLHIGVQDGVLLLSAPKQDLGYATPVWSSRRARTARNAWFVERSPPAAANAQSTR